MEAHKCDKCNKVCKSKFELLYHQKKFCKLLKCPDCGWKFKNRTDLNRHLKSQKKVWCDDCQHMVTDKLIEISTDCGFPL